MRFEAEFRFEDTLSDVAIPSAKAKGLRERGEALECCRCDYGEWGFSARRMAFWRGLKKRYRWLGRCELLPIKSTAEAVARYTGGYIAKHMQHRKPEDKGVNLVRYGKGMHWVKSRLAFNSPRCKLWRLKLGMFALQNGCGSREALKKRFGPRWAYRCAPAIEAVPLLVQLGDAGVIDAGEYGPELALQLYSRAPHASSMNYRPARLRLSASGQERHEWKAGVISMMRCVFGKGAEVF
ncbi:MAG: hypothetical protein WCD79_04865 [Chthoniobacteraceae bacterium]